MKKRRPFLTFLLLLVAALQVHGQGRTCATMDKWNQSAQSDPQVIARRQAAESRLAAWLQDPSHANALRGGGPVTIPVVVHVVYKTANQNVSNAQIQSQIDVLNEDFRGLNPDIVPPGHPFRSVAADCNIEFCLASVNPQGNPTNGITRTSTTADFTGSSSDDVKFTSAGGRDNWDPTRYLNIWVCDLGNQLYGYATFPDELANDPDYDGVVINYTAFGVGGSSVSPSDQGRTATHEIGHWLFLYHIWGDANCGDDLVGDTPPAEQENYGCPSFPSNPFNSCGGDGDGEMYMNYMDYVDDGCMNMFTLDQGNRMLGVISNYRSGLISSGACSSSAAIDESSLAGLVRISPNPGNGLFQVEAPAAKGRPHQISVFNTLGQEVQRHDAVRTFPYPLDLRGLAADIYLVQVSNGRDMASTRLLLQH